MKTKLIVLTIATLVAAMPLTYARGGAGFGGGHFGGGFRGGSSFHGGGRGFYGGNRGFYGGGHQYYGAGRGYYGQHRNWSGGYGHYGNGNKYHHRYYRGGYYYYGYGNGGWLWPYGYYDWNSYPYDSSVYYDDSDDGYYRRSHRKDSGRDDRAARDYQTRRVYRPE